MKIKLNRKNLLEAAALCEKLVIPSKSPLESLPNLRLTASTKLHTTKLLASSGPETAVASALTPILKATATRLSTAMS